MPPRPVVKEENVHAAMVRGSLRRRKWGRELAAAGLTAACVTAVRARQRLGLPPPVTTAIAFSAPLVVARGFPRSPCRDAIVWTAQMWAYKNLFELPNNNPDGCADAHTS